MVDDDPFEDIDVPDDPIEGLDRATEVLTVRTEEGRYGKAVTIIEGFDGSTVMGDLASKLKSALGAGGTVKEGAIELQGDHEECVQDFLEARGHQVER